MKLSRVPALPLLAGAIIGIVLAAECGVGMPIVIISLLAAIFCLWRRWHTSASVLLFVAVGIFMTAIHTPSPVPDRILGRNQRITAKIEKVWGDALFYNYITEVNSVNGEAMHFKTLLSVKRGGVEYTPGDSIATVVDLVATDPRRDIPDELNLYRTLLHQGVVSRAYTEGDSIQYRGWHPSVIQRFTYKAQQFMYSCITQMGCDMPTTDFLLATVAGDDSVITPWREDNFRAVGIAHVLALSGMHVAVVIWLAMIPAGLVMYISRSRKVGYFFLAIVIMLYAFATGMSASVGRAAVMALVFIFSRVLGRKPSPYNSLAVSILIWLCINPFWLYSPGLQLSAVAVFAILWLTPVLCPPTLPYNLRKVLSYIIVPIVAVIGTTMLSVFYFHSLPLWFLPVNIVAGVTVPLLVAAGVIGSLICACGLKLGMLSTLINKLYALLDGTAAFFADMPGGVIEGIYPQWWHLMLYLAAIAIMGWGTWRKRRWLIASGFVLFIAMCCTFANPIPKDDVDALYIPRRKHYTDIIIREGNKATIISDGIDARAYAENIYADYLKSRCIDSLTEVSLQDPLIEFDGRSFLIINRDDIRYSCDSVTYMLVGYGFTGDVVTAAKHANPDTVLIAASLNPRRGARYLRELATAGFAARSLHDTPFAITRKRTDY